MSVVHRVRLPVGATPLVEVGHEVEPAEVLATRRPPGEGTSVPVAAVLRRSAEAAATCLAVSPGTVLEDGDLLAADTRGREVRVPHACLFLSYDLNDGAALVAPLQGTEPIVGHVRGEVTRVEADAIEIRVGGAMVAGVGGSGGAVHGELRLAVRDPADEDASGRPDVDRARSQLVGGSRASAETLTRARAMGVAGIVLGGVLDKELRDFEATQARRREIGGARGDFGVLLLEGFGKVGFDPHLFAWFQAHEGRRRTRTAARRVLARPGDRVVAHRRPYAGMAGELLRVADGLQVTTTGIPARAGIVRFEDGLTAVVPLANLEAAEPRAGG